MTRIFQSCVLNGPYTVAVRQAGRATCRNLMILQAALPASHWTVDVQTASVTLQKNVTTRSAVARCVISRLMVDRRRRMRYMRASVAELPTSATTNMTERTAVCMTDSCVARGTSSAVPLDDIEASSVTLTRLESVVGSVVDD